MAMNFYAAKAPLRYRAFNHRQDTPLVAGCMDEGKADETAWMASDQPGQFRICFRVVITEKREHNGPVDARRLRAPQIGGERSIRIPGRGHAIAPAGMAVKSDDHKTASGLCSAMPCSLLARDNEMRRGPGSPASASMNQMLVSMPLKKLGRWNFSLGAWIRSPGRAKPISTVGTP